MTNLDAMRLAAKENCLEGRAAVCPEESTRPRIGHDVQAKVWLGGGHRGEYHNDRNSSGQAEHWDSKRKDHCGHREDRQGRRKQLEKEQEALGSRMFNILPIACTRIPFSS